MAKSTARTGKLKRSKARKDGVAGATPREASVGELLAALHGPGADTPPSDPSATPSAEARPEAVVDATELVEVTAGPEVEPAAPRADGIELSDTIPMAPEDDLSAVQGKASLRLVSVVESLLFASDRPLTVRDIRRVLKEPTVRQVQLALKHLLADRADHGIILSQVAGGFRLRTNPANAQWIQKLLAGKPTRLSRSQLEALAVIAYRQPITKAEIDHVRGVDCGAVLRVLLERDLARIVGRKEEPGRPHLYGTTVEFLEFFNLRSLRDMPDLHQFRELTDESRAALRDELGEDADEVEAEVLGQEVLPFSDDEGAGEGAPGSAESADEAPADASAAELTRDDAEAALEGKGPTQDAESAAEDAEAPSGDEDAAGDDPTSAAEDAEAPSEGEGAAADDAGRAVDDEDDGVEGEDAESDEPAEPAESDEPAEPDEPAEEDEL